MKRILFLAPATNYHTQKWCLYFYEQGYDVHVISLTDCKIPNVHIYCPMSSNKSNQSDIQKLSYLRLVPLINRIYKELSPDIVSVHYATSYGFLAALSRINKYSLSVWGTDVYAFPKKSLLHKILLRYSLKKATILLSTSRAMAKECRTYTDKELHITPFGVNMELFCPTNKIDRDTFVISNMKSLSHEYGTDVLLKAINEVVKRYPAIKMKIYIAGTGPAEDEFKKLAHFLNIDKYIEWLGLVPLEVIAEKLKNSDIAVIPSYRESFGVSAVEAQACGIPVIISDVEGLKEATSPYNSSIVVEPGNYKVLADAIIDLFLDEAKRIRMGANARDFVFENYELSKCFFNIETILNNF